MPSIPGAEPTPAQAVLGAPTAAAATAAAATATPRGSFDLQELDDSWDETPPSIETSLQPPPPLPGAPPAPPPPAATASAPLDPLWTAPLLAEPPPVDSDRSASTHIDSIPPWARKRSRAPVFVTLAILSVGAVYFIAQAQTPTLNDTDPFAEATEPVSAAPRPPQTSELARAEAASAPNNAAPASSTAKRTKPGTKSAPPPTVVDGGATRAPEPAKATATEPSSVSNEPPATSQVAASPTPATAAPAERPPLSDFNAKAAGHALSGIEGTVLNCRREDDPKGVVLVVVTYAPSGHVSSASVSTAPYAGTFTGSCIERAVRHATIGPFTGDPQTVTTSYQLR